MVRNIEVCLNIVFLKFGNGATKNETTTKTTTTKMTTTKTIKTTMTPTNFRKLELEVESFF